MPSKRRPAAPVAKGNFWQSVTAKSQIYYKRHEMTAGDQPPVGILLCTRKNQALVEFALGDLSNNLFVSRYAVEMPKKTETAGAVPEAGWKGGRV